MEVTADTHETLLSYLEKAKNEDLECEAVFNMPQLYKFYKCFTKIHVITTYRNKGVAESLILVYLIMQGYQLIV